MGDLVNLRTVRKRAKRQQASDQAAENRQRHGVPKAERALRDALRDTALRNLERHRIDKGEGQ